MLETKQCQFFKKKKNKPDESPRFEQMVILLYDLFLVKPAV